MKASLTQTDRYLLATLAVRVIDAEPAEREAIIADATADRPDLRETLTKLVEEPSADLGSDPLADLAEVFRLAVADDSEDRFDQSGTTIDRYTLVRRLGTGAYGAVYLAEQSVPVQRRVALKLLHLGVGSPRVLRRFALERRVLASLEHPGIARLIDAGSATDGRPYIVMDLIEGPDLMTYCRENTLSAAERIRVLASACDAIQHAHARGVIHRDLKPSNILVRALEDAPQPVVIDFGVARLLDPDPALALTSLGQPIGTRRYMSPEQRAGDVADVRSDVYSLGITLLDVIADRTGTSLLSGESRLLAALTAESAGREAEALPKEVRWIVGRCCAERSSERYQSVAELAADLRRLLSGEPLVAAPPSAFYRVSRFLARNPWPTGFALLTVLGLAGFATYNQVMNQQLEAEVVAQRELIVATIDDVLDEVWMFVGSDEARHQIIDRLMRRTDSLLDSRPRDGTLLMAKARLLSQQARLLFEFGDLESMEAAARESLDILDALPSGGESDVDRLRLYAETTVLLGDSLSVRERHDEAAEAFHSAHAMLEAAHQANPTHIGLRDDLCWSYDRLTYLDRTPGRLPLLERQMELAESLVRDSPDRPLSIFALQTAHCRIGLFYAEMQQPPDYAAARQHLQEAWRLGAELTAAEPGRAAWEHAHLESYRALAKTQGRAGKSDWLHDHLPALAAHSDRLEAQVGERWFMLVTVLDTRMTLASLYRQIGLVAESQEQARRAYSICTRSKLREIPRHAGQVERSLKELAAHFPEVSTDR